jgi:CelD/BcsL family acetyltransferase involved in cellulose biosynthesis
MSTIDVIDNVNDFTALAEEWEQLLERTAGVTPFHLPAWQLTWWRHFGSGRLRVFVFRESGRLTGIAPCFLHNWNGRRQLTLIGSGISDYLEPAIEREHAHAVIELLKENLQSREEWDVCDWQDLDADSPLATLSGNRLHVEIRQDQPCSRIPLTGMFRDFWHARGKDLRRNVRRYGLRAEELGAVEFDVMQNLDPALLRSLIELHGARWEARGEPGMIAVNQAAEFLCDVTRQLAPAGLLRIFIVRFRKEIAALNLAFLFRNTIFSYLSAFDPKQEYFGFGRMLLQEAIQYCYAHQVTSWNFLRGAEPYKFSWGAEAVPKLRVYVRRFEQEGRS